MSDFGLPDEPVRELTEVGTALMEQREVSTIYGCSSALALLIRMNNVSSLTK